MKNEKQHLLKTIKTIITFDIGRGSLLKYVLYKNKIEQYPIYPPHIWTDHHIY